MCCIFLLYHRFEFERNISCNAARVLSHFQLIFKIYFKENYTIIIQKQRFRTDKPMTNKPLPLPHIYTCYWLTEKQTNADRLRVHEYYEVIGSRCAALAVDFRLMSDTET